MFESLVFLGLALLLGAVPLAVFRHLKKTAELRVLLEAARARAEGRAAAEGPRSLPAGSPARAAPPETARSATDRLTPVYKSIEAVGLRAAALAAPLHHERANLRFSQPLTEYVPSRLDELKRALKTGAAPESVEHAIGNVELVIDALEALIDQRRDTSLRGKLGDADALAQACYAPIALYAHGQGLPLTSLVPATQLGPFEMSTWTGFIPTSIAPIFLPQDFFQRAVWWPAVGHEIAHDFLASVQGLEGRLRAELGYLPFAQAYLPIDFQSGFSEGEVKRVCGAWFEEIFSDVFGTLMCGPAYVVTMAELFAKKSDPREVFVVGVDPDGRGYDCHPPGHLRMQVGLSVLSLAGFHREAERLRKKWESKNDFKSLKGAGAEAALDLFLLFPAAEGYVRVALEPFETELIALSTRLYAGGLKSLGGVGLRDIPGLDFGPHAFQDGQRAKTALLEGSAPDVRDVRAVISGAVLAASERPSEEGQILELARRAIPAFGTYEMRPGAYDASAVRFGMTIDAESLRDATVLREILQRPSERRQRR